MSRKPFGISEYYHVYNRGVRGSVIFQDDMDRRQFLRRLYYLNHNRLPYNWALEVESGGRGEQQWPRNWGQRQPLVDIHAYCLRDTHFHLVLREIAEGGISKFMQRLGISTTKAFNERYGTSGSLFQGRYQARHVVDDTDLRNLGVYVQVKNGIENHRDGYRKAIGSLDAAMQWLRGYPYSSYGHYVGGTSAKAVTDTLLNYAFENPDAYREFCLQTMRGRQLELEKFDYYIK